MVPDAAAMNKLFGIPFEVKSDGPPDLLDLNFD